VHQKEAQGPVGSAASLRPASEGSGATLRPVSVEGVSDAAAADARLHEGAGFRV